MRPEMRLKLYQIGEGDPSLKRAKPQAGLKDGGPVVFISLEYAELLAEITQA